MERLLENKIVRWLPAVIWMTIIFVLSAQIGDGEHSAGTVYFLERKVFHVLEFMLLAFFVYWGFRGSLSKEESLRDAVIWSLIFAFSDEWHQTQVFGRDGALRDVLIDFGGIMIMVIIILNFSQWKKRWWK